MKIGNALTLKDTGKILHNRFVLYFVLFLALADLLFLAMGSEFVSVAVFILSGFVTSFFSKNMMVVMCVAMVVTNILKYGTDIRMQEGLKDSKDETKAEPKAEAKAKPEAKVEPKSDAKVEPKTEAKPETKEEAKTEIVLTEEQKRKFTENMEKLEAYEPLFTSMDKLMEKINELISP